ncbi:MAG: glycoside hydrolase family 92 protein, partial [Chitinophagaceae bacterium]|nr:glycoside hydrolase family 92 protein [Chitinophagaceae bacterium]
FGMVKLGPDCDLYTATAGYESKKSIIGFSHTHASGTGGGPSYGNVLVMPVVGVVNPENYSSPAAKESAAPGFYSVLLTKNNIQAELTVTHKSGFHQYTFPAAEQSNIIVDAGSFLGHDSTWGEQQIFTGSEINILSRTEIEGYTRIRGGWNMGLSYTVYFYASFDTQADNFGTWKNNKTHEENKTEYDSGEKTGAYFTFKTKNKQVIKVKVGISYISCRKAKANLQMENPGWDFYKIKHEAEDAWNKVLSTVLVKGNSEEDKKIFYTALYHTMLTPTEKNGENPKWLSDEPNYDDFYTVWDTYRSSFPLFTLLFSKRQADIVRSMIDIYEHEGYMPDGRMGNENGRTQGGSNSDNVISDAYVKKLKGINYEKAYLAMKKNAEVPPGGDERKQGRGGIPDYNTLGYLTTRYERAGNRTLEYAHNDYSIASVAKGLGKKDDFLKYRSRAGNWQNLWNPSIQSMSAKGFIWPRQPDGSWATELTELDGTHVGAKMKKIKFNVLTSGSFPNFFYESHSWEYSFYVPHDVKKLISYCGGKEAFVSRLDTFFSRGLYQVGNEPGFLIPVLYVWAGRPNKTALIVDSIRCKYFNSTRSGIPGNDDSGAMSSFFAFHAMGFYPNAGQDVYIISTPLFDKTTVQMDNGNNFTVTATNLDKKNIYVQSATLNGKALNGAWFRHTDILQGGKLDFLMGSTPSEWGRDNPPPSMSDEMEGVN